MSRKSDVRALMKVYPNASYMQVRQWILDNDATIRERIADVEVAIVLAKARFGS